MNLKYWIIKKLGGFTENEVRYMVKNIPIHNSHPETVFYGTSHSKLPKGMAEMAGKTINKFLDNQFIESNKPGLNLTADDLKKVFKDAIKKAKPNDQLPMINGVQLTQEDLNNWYKRKDEKDKEN